jgi:carboxyl-terminal processing protease
MGRLVGSLVLLVALFAPSAAGAQSSQSRARPTRTSGATSGADSGAVAEAEVFRETLRAIRNHSLSPFSDSTLWEKALQGLVESLDDPYAAVLTPDEVDSFREETTGNYSGIGVQITELNDSITVTAVFRGSPANEVGLLEGDRIVRVNDDPAEDWTASDASDRIRGEAGTTVRVYVRRDGVAEPILHSIERGEIHLSAVTAVMLSHDSVGYIGVDRVARNSAAEVDSAFTVLADARGIVLDLRRNPGGYLDEALKLADLFLEEDVLLASTRSRRPGPDAETIEQRGYARTTARIPDKPIVVLVDRFTASAAEILAGALQDHDRATVLGERTFGKGVVQTILPLPAGRQLRLTTGEWYTPLGRSLHRPRDRSGRPLPDPDTFPIFRTKGGRELSGGGGVFPDLAIPNDTLKLPEREVLDAANEAEVNLTVALAEFAFGEAQAARRGEGPSALSDEVFGQFLDTLVEAGVREEALMDPVGRAYLRWRADVAFAQRLNDELRILEERIKRDRVLAEAVKLLEESRTPADVFRAGNPVEKVGSMGRVH